jgi:SET domain-containing protein
MAYKAPVYRDLIAVRTSKIQGRGVFALRRIRKGKRIIEYIGEKISNEEAEKRYPDDTSERHHTFLFELDEETIVDAATGYNISRYINHSCSPNCEAIIDDGHIYIDARKDIKKGEELTYDYSFDVEGRYTKELLKWYVCYCGSRRCRGTILKPRPKKRKKLPEKGRRR